MGLRRVVRLESRAGQMHAAVMQTNVAINAALAGYHAVAAVVFQRKKNQVTTGANRADSC